MKVLLTPLHISLCILAFLLSSWNSQGQTNEELFAQAGSAYQREDWQEAIDLYQKILHRKYTSASLYYNLANAHYKKGEIAPSIYYYEIALQLAPKDPMIQTNLSYAQRMCLDKITPVPKLWTTRLMESISWAESPTGWAIWAIITLCLGIGAFLWYYFTERIWMKRLSFTLFILCLVCSLGCYFLGRIVSHYTLENDFAILFEKEVRFYEAPNTYSKEAFSLHEGTKVEIIDTFEDWCKLKIADGRTGWVKKSTLRTL